MFWKSSTHAVFECYKPTAEDDKSSYPCHVCNILLQGCCSQAEQTLIFISVLSTNVGMDV